MKRLVSIILFLVAVSLGCFAQQRTATLSHNGKLTVFNSERCLPEAYDAAVDGDTIFLSSGNWGGSEFQTNGNFTITKKISFIGNGRSTLLDGFVRLDFKERDDKSLTSTLFDGVAIGNLGIYSSVSNLEIKNSRIYGLLIKIVYSTDYIDFKIQSCETKVSLYNNQSKGLLKGTFKNCKVKVDSFDLEGWDFNDGQNIRFLNCNLNLSGASTFSGYVSSSIVFGKSYEMRPKLLENCLYQWSEVVHDVEWEEREKSEYINCYDLPYTSEADMILNDNLDYVGPDLIASGYVGTDGTQVGIYGGQYAPYTEKTSYTSIDNENSNIYYNEWQNRINVDISFMNPDIYISDPMQDDLNKEDYFQIVKPKVIGYRHFFNNNCLGYVPLANDQSRLQYDIIIPDSLIPKFNDCQVSFILNHTAKLDYDKSNSYVVQPFTDFGWGAINSWEIPIGKNVEKTTRNIGYVPTEVKDNKQSGLGFNYYRFKVRSERIHISASQSACLDIYEQDGGDLSLGDVAKKLLVSISPNELIEGKELNLKPGTYWGIMHDTPINLENPDSIILLRFNKPAPLISYDGRFLKINSDTIEDVVPDRIMYSFDGEESYSTSYYGPVDLKGKLGTIRAWTCDYNHATSNSEVATKQIYGYGNQSMAVTSVPGVLASCYEWNGGRMDGKRFSVAGPLDASDYEWLNTHVSAYHLDLSEVTGNSIPDGALAPEWVKSIVLPSDVKGMSGKIFKTSGAPFNTNATLCALKWTSSEPIPTGMLDSLGNRNMLLYVADASLAADVSDHEHNLVAGGVAESLQLNGAHFYCPEEFVAKEASYYRYNNWETGIDGECAGWKTIVVPYDVQRVEHSKGDLTPFGVNTEMELLRYWLYEPTTSGWERAVAIRANEPYLIAMPNNEVYYEPFNVGGNVWFKATNAVVAVTPDEISRDFAGGRKLVGVYEGMASAEDRFGINHDTVEVGGVTYRPGSVFISQVDKGISPASPFEAYLLGGSTTRAMEIFKSSEVEAVLADMEMKVWTENGGIRIQAGFTARVDIFDMTGRRVAVADVKAGEVCCVDGLAPGIYIAANRKVLLK